MEHNALNHVLILLACSVVAVTLFRRLHLPPILGYLSVGIFTGSHALGWVPEGEAIHLLAEVGVVFLLFMIGLEISIPHLLAMKGTVIGLGGAQVLFTMLVVGILCTLMGIDWKAALLIGGITALSSTAIAVKQMVEQMELQSRHGRMALGILLFQDLAVVPFLVLIPILAEPAGQSMLMPILWALGKGLMAFALMLAIGHWLLRPLFHLVAGARSIELLTLTILLVALSAAALTDQFGLSLALGAFLAGMMLGETEYRHQIESEIRPFRDVLMGLFFISVGAQLNLATLSDNWLLILLITLGLVLGKGVLVVTLARLGGYELGVALRTGLVLAQGGEFGFALITLGIGHGLFDSRITQPLLAAIVFSMLLAPLLIRYNGLIARRLCSSYANFFQKENQQLARASDELSGHVIICGFGRIGQNLATFLREEGFDYVALDTDPSLIKDAWDAGEHVFFGDSKKSAILEAAGIQRARVLVTTFYDRNLTEHTIHAARRVSANIMVVSRTRDERNLEELEKAGANDVVPESLEASMMLAAHTLRHLEVERDEIRALIDKARSDRYKRLRGYFHGEQLEGRKLEENFHRRTVVLAEHSRAIGQTLAALGLERFHLEVVALLRQGIHGETPDPALVLKAEDTLILQGQPQDLALAGELLLAEP